MHILLTHEQADFDALASLLAASLLHEGALPVLPARLNRNLRNFLTLYGSELPFLERRDLPAGETITAVTLVDTQSLPTLKNMSKNLQVQVIDHHPRRANLPEHWYTYINETGATVTLLVEALQERAQPLNLIQATLLLLGIYEDTGSLTYSRTTPRDLRAAAYLLEHAADLRIAQRYLEHPLSLAQESLFQELYRQAETHSIHGRTVVIACGDATQLDEELSTIAHKLRNLLDPDALFLLLATRSGVQMVARSTNDAIDVAQIARHFKGGGHTRAAAALLRDADLPAILQQLLEILPQAIEPPITVSQIMSPHPQTLSPETSAQAAAERMQRYGYEGYPVVENGQVIGLLTRRAVDRAINHHLNLPARSLMQAGNYAVHPHHAIEHLRALMTETNWGQMPVTDPQTGKIIGIVTRTDLLKTLPQRTQSAIPPLAERLERSLPAAHLALLKLIASLANQQRLAIYIVGGFVRDLLLNRPSLDFDLVIEGDAIPLAQALQRTYGGRITTHGRFGTAKWHIAEIHTNLYTYLRTAPDPFHPLPDSLDLITARTEFYTHPTALPTVERGSIKLDLHRRDFTINTLALRLDGAHYGELHDYWGGYNDLKHGLVRVLHSLSFVDDPTRILRAVRYEQRYQFQIETRTLQLINEARDLFKQVSGDRLRHELNHILAEPHRNAMLQRLNDLQLLQALHGDLTWDEWLAQKFNLIPQVPPPQWDVTRGPGSDTLPQSLAYALWMMRLPAARAQNVLESLKMPRAVQQIILAACELYAILQTETVKKPSQWTAQLEAYSSLTVYSVYLGSDASWARDILQTYVNQWKHRHPHTTGSDLRALGLPPGPQYNRILTRLRAAHLDGEITTPEEERTLLKNLLATQNAD